MTSAILDFASALFGVVIAWVIYFKFGEVLGINPDYVDEAFWFTVASLFALVSTPTGIVRALDRFDLAVYVEALVPSLRLLAAVAIWLTDTSVLRFLIAWAAIDLIEAAGYWILSRRLCPEAVSLRHLKDWQLAGRDNPGIVRFSLVAFASSTLDAAVKQGPLLAVGYLVGTKAAGLYRLANQLSQGLGKLSGLLTRAAYAEINRARVAAEYDEFRRLVRQTSLIAAVAGFVVVLLALMLGRQLLDLIGGDDFDAGYAVLIPLTFAASLELASVAFEPVLHSTGHARYALYGRLFGFIVLAGVIAWFAGNATAIAVGLAVAIGAIATYIALGALAWHTMAHARAQASHAG
jgi:O-antigen/teichoic acid export membrane protein